MLIISHWRINKYNSLQHICIKLWTIYLSIILFLFSLKHTQEARRASGHVLHMLVFFFKQKIIACDYRSRRSQTFSICCILIDGDNIIQMNFSTLTFLFFHKILQIQTTLWNLKHSLFNSFQHDSMKRSVRFAMTSAMLIYK